MPMDIIIRRLPETTTRDELFEFAAKALRPRWYFFQFSPLCNITDCEIYKVSDVDDNVIAYNGLIHVESEESADRLVDRLNAKQFHQRSVDAAVYRSRNNHDRRLTPEDVANHPHHGARTSDRRVTNNHMGPV